MQLFPPQQKIIDIGLLEKNEHCFLNMATGTGKTYLSEFAIENVVKTGYKALYITPLRALAAQQHSNWKKRFSEYKVGVFTGDTVQKSITRGNYHSSQILIMTPERLDSCLRNWRSHWNWIPEVSLIVIDEVHILGQAGRGARLEGSITRFIRLNPFVRIIGLSATIPNAEELSKWLCGTSFSSQWRQVPLEKRIVRFTTANDKPKLLLNEVARCINDGGQSLIFCNSRSRVQHVADYLNANGIVTDCHHAGLAQNKRIETENAYKNGYAKALVATSTLEMGLNLPARQVVIYDSYSFSESGFNPLPVWSFIQRAGRAGRPGLDDSGEVVLMLAKWAGSADKYIDEDCESIISQLTSQKAMSEQILIDVFAGYSRTRDELINGYLPLTLYKKQHPEANINSTINRLVLSDLLIEKEVEDDIGDARRFLKVALLGRLSVKFMFAPSTVQMIRDAYTVFERLYFFDLLLIATLSEDCSPLLQTNYEELDALCEIVQPLKSSFMDLNVEHLRKKLTDTPGTLRILAAIKMAAICYSLTDGKSASDIADCFNIYEADVYMLKESVVRLMQGISAIISAIDNYNHGEEAAKEKKQNINSAARLSGMLANMLLYEIDSELISLTHISGVGGKTAKRLAENGYTTLQEIANANPQELSVIKGIGKRLAVTMVKESKQFVEEKKQIVYREGKVDEINEARAISTTFDPYRLRRSMELIIRGHEGGKYCVTGGREDHIVLIRGNRYTCDCQDFAKNGGYCKHILCVKRAQGDPEVCKMANRIKANKSYTIREALPSLWYSVAYTRKE